MNRALLKQNAKNSFKKKWFESAIVALIMSVFAGGSSFSFNLGSGDSEPIYEYSANSFGELFSMIPSEILYTFISVFTTVTAALTVAGIFLGPIFTVGGNRYFLKLRKGLHTDIGEVTGNFKDGNYWNIVKISFVRGVKILLWTCLFFIPGIIKTFEYYLIDYILAVRPDIDSKTAFKMSKKLMDGHKMDAFVLGLSFLGWNILGGFTCGILNIAYVNPYMFATYNEFYCYVRETGIQNGIITPMDLPDYQAPFDNNFDMNSGFSFNPQAQSFNQGYQESFNQQQEPVQIPFWQESNQPIDNIDNMPTEEPTTEAEAKEVEFTQVDENND